MVYTKRTMIIDEYVLEEIADDLIEVATNAKDKESFRLKIMSEKFKYLSDCALSVDKDCIMSLSDAVKRTPPSSAEMAKLLKKIASRLNEYIKTLNSILRKW